MMKFKHTDNELISAEISWDGRHILAGYYNGDVKIISFKQKANQHTINSNAPREGEEE